MFHVVARLIGCVVDLAVAFQQLVQTVRTSTTS
jgi:hypothetical protein